jgi:hypothetical protein
LAADGDTFLYIGLGLPDGYDTGDGTAEVWKYDGHSSPYRISGVDQFGGAVQCLLSVPGTSSDCNGNQVPDECDISSGFSENCNGNDIPDECEADCNGNNIPDDCDVDPSDPDGDLQVYPDCNGNGAPDSCDITDGTSFDCNNNAVPDECEIDLNTPGGDYYCDPAVGFELPGGAIQACDPNFNENGVPDECEAVFVDQDNVPETRDGTGWARAFETLQQGLQAAAANPAIKTVYVAGETYTPDEAPETLGDRSASFGLIPNVAVVGGFAGYGGVPNGYARDLLAYETILSGDLYGDDETVGNAENSYHVVKADWSFQDSGKTAILDGFTVTAGHAESYDHGAGVYCRNSSPLITSCTIAGNVASGSSAGGGGFYAAEAGLPRLANCLIAGNTATQGGAVYAEHYENLLIVNCTIAANQSQDLGVVYLSSSDAEIVNTIVWGNANGSVYRADGGSVVTISHSVIEDGWPEPTVMNEDPRFVDGDGPDNIPWTWRDNDYHLAAGSPCIDRGDGAALLSGALRDFELDPRSQQCLPDIGADETSFEQDCNGNFNCDNLDIPPYGEYADCNLNGIPDVCDVDEGRSRNCYGDPGMKVPDECEGT